jgi:hypothetical protein
MEKENQNTNDLYEDYLDDHFFNPYACHICGEDPCSCFDDICCYDPRYTGQVGSCRCADQAAQDEILRKEELRRKNFFSRNWDILTHWLWGLYFDIRHKIQHWNTEIACGQCGEKSLRRKWKGLICPKCHEEDLPF